MDDLRRAEYLAAWRQPDGWAPCMACPWARNCTLRRACWHAAVAHVLPACGACPYGLQWYNGYPSATCCEEAGHCWWLMSRDPAYKAWVALPLHLPGRHRG